MSADEFQAWMSARRVRVATGRPAMSASAAAPQVPRPDNTGTAAVAASPPAPPTATPSQPPIVSAPATASRTGGLILQVASFSARDNADRALAMLQGAGQRVWRLRVGPLDAAAAPELTARIQGLGFGPPQRVRN